MKLLIEEIEDFEIITEATNDKKNYYIRGPFMQCETVNRNNRFYSKNIMEKAVSTYVNNFVNKNRAVGTLGHEDTPKVSEDKISHRITSLQFEGNDVIGNALVLNTKNGRELSALIEGGVSFGCSSRALGSIKEGHDGIKHVQDDFTIATVDAVLQPSGISCYVEGIYEGADWVFVDGQGWVEQYKEQAQKVIRQTNSKDIERVALKIFENYMNRL